MTTEPISIIFGLREREKRVFFKSDFCGLFHVSISMDFRFCISKSGPKVDSKVKIQSCVWRVLDASTVFLSTPRVGRSHWGRAQGSERVGTRQSEIAQG